MKLTAIIWIKIFSHFLSSKFSNPIKIPFFFYLAKESWIVNGMIDYYAHTNSYRIFEVLVKVQSPHDMSIFNKLQKYLQESNQMQKRTALTMFGQLVRRHPTWLHKVVGHGFLRELLKLLKVGRKIIYFYMQLN